VLSLNARVAAFDATIWWQERGGKTFGPPDVKEEALDVAAAHLHNPYAGISYAWQLTETVDQFLARCPPATTQGNPHQPWIYICNPYIPRKHKSDAQNQKSNGNEDEAPEEEDAQLSALLGKGTEMLQLLNDEKANIGSSGKNKGMIAREIKNKENECARELQVLAYKCRIRTGKVIWIRLLPTPKTDDVLVDAVCALGRHQRRLGTCCSGYIKERAGSCC
jgi:hypothetical protein